MKPFEPTSMGETHCASTIATMIPLALTQCLNNGDPKEFVDIG
jgi:hypothetical protein